MQITSDEAEITYHIHISISKKELEEFLIQLDNLLDESPHKLNPDAGTELVVNLYNAFSEYAGE